MMHLVVDLLGCRRWPDLASSQRMLLELAHAMRVQPLSGPHVAELGNGSAVKGISGVLIIMESHIAFHTWPELGQAYVDVFSCKFFDEQPVVETLAYWFDPTIMDRRLLPRRGLAGA